MQIEIDKRGGGEFDRRETLVELPRRQEPSASSASGIGAPVSIMAREAAQDFRPLQPMLVELRGKLDEIARDIGSREQGIGHVGQHAVQGVAEFVEQRARVIEAQQAGFARRAGLAKFITLTMIGWTSPSSLC